MGRQDEIIHDLSPSVKCVAPLIRNMSKYEMQEGTPPPVAPLLFSIQYNIVYETLVSIVDMYFELRNCSMTNKTSTWS